MGIFWVGIAWFVGSFLGKIVFRVMATLGIGYVTYQGLAALIEPYLAQLGANTAALYGFGPYFSYAVDALRIVPSISMVLAALQFVVFIKFFAAVGRRALPGG